jgi:Chromo (CHRromatin Organisation MOdifier) domain
MAEGVAALYLKWVYSWFGLLAKLISDCNTRFTSKFAKGLCNTLQIKQNISMTYHPQTDGQSEQINQFLETYLHFYCEEKQDNWDQWLPFAEFAHNQWPNNTMKKTPYKLIMGYTPELEWNIHPSQIPAVEERLGKLEEIWTKAFNNILKAQESLKMKKQGSRCFKPYKEGEQVWIEGTNIKTLYPTAKLGPKWYGPFKVLKQLSAAVYWVEIPKHWKIHNVFHANLIMPYKETELHGPNFTWPPPDLVNGEDKYKVEKIIDMKQMGRGRKTHYLVKWKGYPTSDNSWEPRETIHMEALIKEFHKRNSKHTRTKAR